MALTGNNHHLTAVLIIKAVLALACKHVGCKMGNVLNLRVRISNLAGEDLSYTQCNRRKLMTLADREGKDALSFRLLGIEK